MTTHPFEATRTACSIVLSTAITAAIFGLVIVLPARAETPPPGPATGQLTVQPAVQRPVHPALAGRAATSQADGMSPLRLQHSQPFSGPLPSRGPSSAVDTTTREFTAEGDIVQRLSVSSGDTTLEARTVLQEHDTRLMGDRRIGAPGVNYGPSRERSLQGRTSDSPLTVKSSGFGFTRRID